MDYFNILVDAGLTILDFGRTTAESIVQTFISPISENFPFLGGTDLGDFSLLTIMVGIGLPIYIVYALTKFVTGIIL